MSAHQQNITLDSIITDYLEESEQSIHKYKKCFNAAFRCMDDLGLDFFYQIKSMRLPINANKTVNLPNDYLNYTKVGVLNNKGEVIPLYSNNNLTSYADLFPNRLALTVDNPSLSNLDANPFAFNNFWSDGSIYTLYGLPSGAPFVGNFKIDSANSLIVLDHHFSYDYLILEYVASPVEGQEYYVPIQFREAIISWLSWKDIKSLPTTRKGGLGDKGARRHDYYNDRRLAIARYKPFRPQEAHQLNMENTRLTVKI